MEETEVLIGFFRKPSDPEIKGIQAFCLECPISVKGNTLAEAARKLADELSFRFKQSSEEHFDPYLTSKWLLDERVGL